MGICSSCLRARDKRQSNNNNSETQPLLTENNATDNDGASDDNDFISLQRQQDLTNIVHYTHEYFIDVSSIPHTEPTDQSVDTSALKARLDERQGQVRLSIPEIDELSSEEQQRLGDGIAQLDMEKQKAKTNKSESKSKSKSNGSKQNKSEPNGSTSNGNTA